MRKELVDRDAKNVAYRRSIAWSFSKLGRAFTLDNNLPRALEAHEEALALRKALVAESPSQGGFKNELASSEVELELGNPGILGDPIIQAAAAGLQSFVRMIGLAVTVPATAAPRWGEYGSAFEALAAAEWVRRLRVLGIGSGHMRGLMGLFAERPQDGAESSAGTFPDSAVLALAAALDRDKLERLVLPAALVSPSARDELTRRMGSTVEFR